MAKLHLSLLTVPRFVNQWHYWDDYLKIIPGSYKMVKKLEWLNMANPFIKLWVLKTDFYNAYFKKLNMPGFSFCLVLLSFAF